MFVRAKFSQFSETVTYMSKKEEEGNGSYVPFVVVAADGDTTTTPTVKEEEKRRRELLDDLKTALHKDLIAAGALPALLSTLIHDKKNLLKLQWSVADHTAFPRASSPLYLVMVTGRVDHALIRLGRRFAFPRGFPLLWRPRQRSVSMCT
jgi:hypothetical protein